MRYKPWAYSNVPPVACAPWKVELPGGKALHGSKKDVLKAALQSGVTRILSRADKRYFDVDLETGMVTEIVARKTRKTNLVT